MQRSFKKRLSRNLLAAYCRIMHQRIAARVRRRTDALRVGYLVSNLASWKADEVAKVMEASDNFHVVIYLCPLTRGGLAERAEVEITKLRALFQNSDFDVVDLSLLTEDNARRRLDADGIDLFIFTNPHKLSWPAVHEQLFRRVLSAYLPYSHEVAEYSGNLPQYDQSFHNAMWRIYVAHQNAHDLFRAHRTAGDRDVVVSGYPCCEAFWAARGQGSESSGIKTVVWAPHWILNEELQWATVYELGKDMMSVATEFQDRIHWVVRPHPLLRQNLEAHQDWGPDKTNAFFDFWSNAPFSRIEEGDYQATFIASDALIHDSGSFLAEYLYLDRPVMYLRTEQTAGEGLNAFGRAARSACRVGGSKADVEVFLRALIEGDDQTSDARAAFITRELEPLMPRSPSEVIAQDILQALRPGHLNVPQQTHLD